LKKAQGLRWEWAGAQREVGERQRQLRAVAGDQSRLRADLREVPQTSPSHRRYLDQDVLAGVVQLQRVPLGLRADGVEDYQ
jgi:hypothetical protein